MTTDTTGSPPDHTGDEMGVALTAAEQRRVALMDTDEILAVRAEDGDIYVPLREMCGNLGIARVGQVRRIRADQVMAEGLRDVRVRTPLRGLQTMQCLRLDVVPFWLSGLEPSRVKPELREHLIAYKRWIVRRVWEAFSAETGLDQALHPAAGAAMAPTQEMTLEQIAQLGYAIATLARQQLAYEHDLVEMRGQLFTQGERLVTHEEHLTEHDARFDRAAEVIRDVIREVRTVQSRLSAGATITDEQAATIQTMVRDIATAIARKEAAAGLTGKRPNVYQALFGALYRQFGCTSYKLIRADRYAEVIGWLREYQQAHDA